jgi:hypothetical protein
VPGRPSGAGRVRAARRDDPIDLTDPLAGNVVKIRSIGRAAADAQQGRQGAWRPAPPRVRTELYIRATNVLNTVNKSGFSGVMTSPLFGLPRSAQAARRAELGMRVRF